MHGRPAVVLASCIFLLCIVQGATAAKTVGSIKDVVLVWEEADGSISETVELKQGANLTTALDHTQELKVCSCS